jgi:hypothetical protein
MRRLFDVGDQVAGGTVESIPKNRPGFYNVKCNTCGFVRIKKPNVSGCQSCNKKTGKAKKYSVGDLCAAGKIVGGSDEKSKYLVECQSCFSINRVYATSKKCMTCYKNNRRKYYEGAVLSDGRIMKKIKATDSFKNIKILLDCPRCHKEVWKNRGSLFSICFSCKNEEISLNLKNKKVVNKISTYRKSARARNIAWEIENHFAQKLFFSRCHYCNYYNEEKMNGIDRVDSSLGYTYDNVVPCCTYCNMAKGSKSLDDWNGWINGMIEFNKKKEESYD